MKQSFIGSLICPGGILGGGIYIDGESVSYRTNKLTVDRRYKNLVLPLDRVASLSWKWIIFPIATLKMTSGDEYKFIIFNKARFEKCFAEAKKL